jgi:glyoxylase-like metal-dependent hydrolase (beta-lactamase superfamily II)
VNAAIEHAGPRDELTLREVSEALTDRRARGVTAVEIAWFGFDAVRELRGLPPEILLVPLPGHTHGHTGVAVRSDSTAGGEERWLLHAGDAYFFHGQLDPERPHAPAGVRLFERRQQVDGQARMDNQSRLRELANSEKGRVDVISAHDPADLDRHLAVAS